MGSTAVRKYLLTIISTVLPLFALAQSREFRFSLAYGDEQLVQLARSAGTDPLAALGREIPQGVTLQVPSFQPFKVQVHTVHNDMGFGTVYVNTYQNFMAYDRARLFHVATTTAPQLDEHSFRKLSPRYTGNQELNLNASNFQSRTVYDLNRNTRDENGDGVPDLATWRRQGGSVGAGGYLPIGNTNYVVRPAGIGMGAAPLFRLANGNVGAGWVKLLPGERMHMFDLEYTNALAVGETYGYGAGETGLLLHTTGGDQDGEANNMGFQRNDIFNPEPWRNIGAKYNLIGAAPVPEPGSAVALALGVLAFAMRRRGD